MKPFWNPLQERIFKPGLGVDQQAYLELVFPSIGNCPEKYFSIMEFQYIQRKTSTGKRGTKISYSEIED